MKTVSIERIYSKLNRELRKRDVSTRDVVNWTGEALEFIKCSEAYEPAFKVLEVKGFQAQLPSNYHLIIQLARNNEYDDIPVTDESLAQELVADTVNNDIPVALDKLGMPIHEYELAYYRPYFDLLGEFFAGGREHYTKKRFSPIRLADHSFFGTQVCYNEAYEKLYQTCRDEYTIVADKLRFSFETGQVILAYLRQQVDKDGFPMIPDNIHVITAITKYITYKLREIDFDDGKQGSDGRLMKAESDWHWYCRQAINDTTIPQTIDDWENILKQRNYLIPQTEKYSGFFGRLSYSEKRNMIGER